MIKRVMTCDICGRDCAKVSQPGRWESYHIKFYKRHLFTSMSIEGDICAECAEEIREKMLNKSERPLESEDVKSINDIRRAAGFEPVVSYEETIKRIVDGAPGDDNENN